VKKCNGKCQPPCEACIAKAVKQLQATLNSPEFAAAFESTNEQAKKKEG